MLSLGCRGLCGAWSRVERFVFERSSVKGFLVWGSAHMI